MPSSQKALVEEIERKLKVDQLTNLINMSDAVYVAVACAWSKNGNRSFERWRKKIVRKRDKLLNRKQNLPNFWDNIKGSRKI